MQYHSVAVLDGGWQAWLTAGHPISTKVEVRTSVDFNNKAKAGGLVVIEDVESARMLIDAREPARYRGEVEPIDRKAGHIPGAINRFWKDNVSENGLFKEQQTLKQEFEQILGGTTSADAVIYCGSGVTACHNLLAASHAGLKMPKLYAGSWSEWSNTTGRAIATGA